MTFQQFLQANDIPTKKAFADRIGWTPSQLSQAEARESTSLMLKVYQLFPGWVVDYADGEYVFERSDEKTIAEKVEHHLFVAEKLLELRDQLNRLAEVLKDKE